MTNVKLPRCRATGGSGEPLHPISLSVTQSLDPLSTANMILPISDEISEMDLVTIFTPDGVSDIYRVNTISTDMTTGLQNVYLEHHACTLGDHVIVNSDGTIENVTMTDTITNILTKILSYQSRWQIGTVQSTDTIYIDLGGMTLLSAITEMMNSIPGYQVEFRPNTTYIDIKVRPTTPVCEGRLSRNLKTCEVSYDRQGMCTRVYNKGLNGGKLDSANIATYGLYEEMLTLNESLSSAQKLSIAQAYLDAHDHPMVSVSISAVELGQITGLTIDKFEVGTVCRLAVPWINVVVSEVIIQKSYDDVFQSPESISLMLANAKPDLSLSIASLARGGGGMANEQEKQKKRFETHFEQTDEYFRLIATDTQWDELENGTLNVYSQIVQTAAAIQSIVSRTGYTTDAFFLPESYYVAGDIVMYDGKMYEFTAAHHGAWTGTDVTQINEMYSSLTQAENNITTLVSKTGINSLGQNETLYSEISQNADKIALVVTSSGGSNSINAASIVAAVNSAGSSVTINADKIVLNGQTLVTEISGIEADFTNLTTGVTTASYLKATNMYTTGMTITGNNFLLGGNTIGFYNIQLPNVRSKAFLGTEALDLGHSHSITATESSGVITLTLGATQSADGTANFNIADTAFYQNAVSAARSAGAAAVDFDSSSPLWGSTTTSNNNTYTVGLTNNKTLQQTVYVTVDSTWSNGTKYARLRTGSSSGAQRARATISLPAVSEATWQWVNTAQGYWQACCTIGGRTYSDSHQTG